MLGTIKRRMKSEDEAFMRSLTFPQEELHKYTTAKWSGGYRWFSSPNVVCFEHYRRVLPESPKDKVAKQG